MRWTAAVAVLLYLLPSASGTAQPTSSAERDRAEVLAVTQRLFDAMQARDTAAMRRLFHESATLVGMRPVAGGGVRLQLLTAGDFIGFVGRDARPRWTERLWSPEVRIEGTLAAIWAPYDFHFGNTFSHCGVDAIHLLKTPDGWRIMSIADTYQTTGCPARPAPPGV